MSAFQEEYSKLKKKLEIETSLQTNGQQVEDVYEESRRLCKQMLSEKSNNSSAKLSNNNNDVNKVKNKNNRESCNKDVKTNGHDNSRGNSDSNMFSIIRNHSNKYEIVADCAKTGKRPRGRPRLK